MFCTTHIILYIVFSLIFPTVLYRTGSGFSTISEYGSLRLNNYFPDSSRTGNQQNHFIGQRCRPLVTSSSRRRIIYVLYSGLVYKNIFKRHEKDLKTQPYIVVIFLMFQYKGIFLDYFLHLSVQKITDILILGIQYIEIEK